jgi:hypothetical protein
MTLLLPSGYLATDPLYSSVPILLHGDGSNGSTVFVDSSPSARTPLYVGGNTSISTAQSQFGKSSIRFDGSGDYLGYASSTAFDLPGDFTIEFWLHMVATGGGMLVRRRLDTSGVGSWGFVHETGNIVRFTSLTGSGDVAVNLGTYQVNRWHHCAVTRQGNRIRGFIDGALGASAFSSIDFTSTWDLFLGAWDRSGSGSVPTQNYMNGYIEDLRITKGFARYTVPFFPPLTRLPDTASR